MKKIMYKPSRKIIQCLEQGSNDLKKEAQESSGEYQKNAHKERIVLKYLLEIIKLRKGDIVTGFEILSNEYTYGGKEFEVHDEL